MSLRGWFTRWIDKVWLLWKSNNQPLGDGGIVPIPLPLSFHFKQKNVWRPDAMELRVWAGVSGFAAVL